MGKVLVSSQKIQFSDYVCLRLIPVSQLMQYSFIRTISMYIFFHDLWFLNTLKKSYTRLLNYYMFLCWSIEVKYAALKFMLNGKFERKVLQANLQQTVNPRFEPCNIEFVLSCCRAWQWKVVLHWAKAKAKCQLSILISTNKIV
jgi:hypothetical protein